MNNVPNYQLAVFILAPKSLGKSAHGDYFGNVNSLVIKGLALFEPVAAPDDVLVLKHIESSLHASAENMAAKAG